MCLRSQVISSGVCPVFGSCNLLGAVNNEVISRATRHFEKDLSPLLGSSLWDSGYHELQK